MSIRQPDDIDRALAEGHAHAGIEKARAQLDGLYGLYAERASVVAALARCARAQGLVVGFAPDPKEPDWPVLFIELPTGQVSWHFSKDDRERYASDIGEFRGTWDGHTTEEKYDRLARWLLPFPPGSTAVLDDQECEVVAVDPQDPSLRIVRVRGYEGSNKVRATALRSPT